MRFGNGFGLNSGGIFTRTPLLGLGYINPAISYTRVGPKTYFNSASTLLVAADNVFPDEYDPVTHAYRGKTVWQGSTNGVYPSSIATSWTVGNVTLTTGQTDPAAGTTAVMMTVDSTNNLHRVNQPAYGWAPANVGSFCYSVFLKAGTASDAVVDLSDSATGSVNIYINLSTGASTNEPNANLGSWTNPVYGVIPLSNGWYRVWVSGTKGNTTANPLPQIFVGVDENSYLGNGTDSIITFGEQVEQTVVPTPYIPTTSAAVTRNIDLPTFPSTAAFWNGAQGTIIVKFSLGTSVWVSAPRIFSGPINAPSYLNLSGVALPLQMQISQYPTPGAAASTVNTVNATGTNIAACAWNGSGFTVCLNGGATAALAATPTQPTTLYLGLDGNGETLNGGIISLDYDSRTLSAAELQSQT